MNEWERLRERLQAEYDELLTLSIDYADHNNHSDSVRLLAVASGVWTAIHSMDLIRPIT